MFFQQQKDSDFDEMEAWLNEQVSSTVHIILLPLLTNTSLPTLPYEVWKASPPCLV